MRYFFETEVFKEPVGEYEGKNLDSKTLYFAGNFPLKAMNSN